jgi:adenine-specific DNA-methyltransferase
MYPRLKLLHKLLSEDGVIFISIDDVEASFLKLICDEIFGRNSFLAQFIWKSRQNKDNRNLSRISVDHEYILCYGSRLNGVERDESKFSNPDNDERGSWVSANMVGLADKVARPNLHYDLIDPETGINYGCPAMGWRYDQSTMNRLIEERRILWPKSKTGRPRKKQFINDYQEEVTGFSSIIGNDIYTRDGTNALREIFQDNTFDFPKPVELVKELIAQASDQNSIVLDSFAGSGTTAHAVLNLNKQDGGARKFILVEMEDYADTVTAERVKRVIKGYGGKEGTGGSFGFYRLGPPLFAEDGNLNEEAGTDNIRRYVWYTETKTAFTEPPASGNPFFLGMHNDTAYYFFYEPGQVTSLSHDFLSTIKTRAGQYVIYADNCLLTGEFLTLYHIIFKKIPRDVTRF